MNGVHDMPRVATAKLKGLCLAGADVEQPGHPRPAVVVGEDCMQSVVAKAYALEGQEGGGIAKKLRDSGFLTRDGRMKERKKYGRKGARKAFQFSKR